MKINKAANFLGLDIGDKRIGISYAGNNVSIAIALTTLVVDGSERLQLHKLINEKAITDVVIGLPRNQSGELTAQSATVKRMADELLQGQNLNIHFQDESLTSVTAEERLKVSGRAYKKADIDMQAALIILQDYLEQPTKAQEYGHPAT